MLNKLACLVFREHQLEDRLEIDDDHIYLEGVLVGWGCSCLQVTFQVQSLHESLRLYDQLLPLTAVMVSLLHLLFVIDAPFQLALSAACPIWKGYLADIDCRYDVMSQASDDRTPEEQARSTLTSRCSSTPLYLSDENNHFNDVKLDMNEDVVSTLARHFAYLLIRDPLAILREHLHPTDDSSTYHFEVSFGTVIEWILYFLMKTRISIQLFGTLFG